MTADPTLFDELRQADAEGRRFGQVRDDAEIVPYLRETLRLLEEHGISADLPTVEAACEILMKLWRAHQKLEAALADVIEAHR